ncbi:DUF308 domain-containing protein [Blastopirellula marina]|uniref:DUF308 domain-containing protein n=1 Tax=Blastopirellula marina TaxID=124 RepID=A0A2S8F7K5_9BACT|nr:DUF308 domain-containing protein [Blastopirellula marina]PQO28136.1 hypothetical protein C5Y98_24845 [Blastopirellula marina]PTL41676.1 DUF308 domain-containing protein [Blastopirellula marina]
MQSTDQTPALSPSQWLKIYYFVRALVSIAWIAAAIAVGKSGAPIEAILIIGYPAWDALANYLDAQKSGGLWSNPTQALNLAISTITGIAVAIALGFCMNAVIIVFGVWAILSGVLQLATAVRRWKLAGAQWLMIVSGVQSALAGAFFFKMALGMELVSVVTIAPYAAFGAFYFLVSAIWLTVKDAGQRSIKATG